MRTSRKGKRKRRCVVTEGSLQQEELSELRTLVARREVCWDVFMERIVESGKTRTIGYELMLSGIHAPASRPPFPGCELCKSVVEDLRRIALWILPEDDRASVHALEPYQPVIRRPRRRHHREEVTLSIKILHRHRYQDPLDECERRCLRDMERRLKVVGACEGEWKPPALRPAPPDLP
jgi:hypothetical protein